MNYIGQAWIDLHTYFFFPWIRGIDTITYSIHKHFTLLGDAMAECLEHRTQRLSRQSEIESRQGTLPRYIRYVVRDSKSMQNNNNKHMFIFYFSKEPYRNSIFLSSLFLSFHAFLSFSLPSFLPPFFPPLSTLPSSLLSTPSTIWWMIRCKWEIAQDGLRGSVFEWPTPFGIKAVKKKGQFHLLFCIFFLFTF